MSTTRFKGTAKFEINDHNLMDQSEELGGVWTIVNGGIVAPVTDPIGGNNANRVSDADAVNIMHLARTLGAFKVNGTKALIVSVKEGAATNPQQDILVRDTTASINRATIRVTAWVAGVPTVSYLTGVKLWARTVLQGFIRLAISVPGVVAANTHEVRIIPAGSIGTAQADIIVYGVQVVDVAIAGGYVRTGGTAILYDGSFPQEMNLALPLQQVRPRKARWIGQSTSLNQRVREVTSLTDGAYAVHAVIRYEDEPQLFIDILDAASRGFPLVYIPDDTAKDTAFEMELIEPRGPIGDIPFDVDQQSFDEHRLDVVLQRMDGGNLSALF